MRKLTRAEVEHLRRAVQDLRDLINGYPELVTQRVEDRLLIAEEILNESHEDTPS